MDKCALYYPVARPSVNPAGPGAARRARTTSLRQRLLPKFNVSRPPELFRLNLFAQDRSVVASLAHLVNQEAEAGDEVSKAILIEAAGTLAETFRDLVSVLGLGEQSHVVVGTGSLRRRARGGRSGRCARRGGLRASHGPARPAVPSRSRIARVCCTG